MGEDLNEAGTTVNGEPEAKPCKLPTCKETFRPGKRPKKEFCSDKCKVSYHILAHNEGVEVVEKRRRESRRIHFGRVENSPRLQRALAVLADGEWHTAEDIEKKGCVRAGSAIVGELKGQGYDIEKRRRKDGRMEYRWKGDRDGIKHFTKTRH